MLPRLLRGLVLLAGLAAATLAGLWFLQRRLLYFPVRTDRAVAERAASALGLEPWTEGETFHGWVRRTPGARGRVLVFHGNAGTALDRIYVAAALAGADPDLPLDVYLAEYPGYGPRPGEPSQPAILEAAGAALAAVRGTGSGPLLLAGESLGSAVAVLSAVAAPGAVDGLLLVTPLASVPAVARRHYPFVPGVVHRDRWRADLALPRWRGRLAVVLAGEDEVVFADLGRALFEASPGPKRLWIDPAATHNTVDWRPAQPRWREVVRFLADPG